MLGFPWEPGLTDLMEISEDQVENIGDYNGTGWIIMFDIESWDNDTDQALLEVTETDGFSHYDVGELIYMSWQIDDYIGKFYYAMGDYAEPSDGTEGSEFYTYTQL